MYKARFILPTLLFLFSILSSSYDSKADTAHPLQETQDQVSTDEISTTLSPDEEIQLDQASTTQAAIALPSLDQESTVPLILEESVENSEESPLDSPKSGPFVEQSAPEASPLPEAKADTLPPHEIQLDRLIEEFEKAKIQATAPTQKSFLLGVQQLFRRATQAGKLDDALMLQGVIDNADDFAFQPGHSSSFYEKELLRLLKLRDASNARVLPPIQKRFELQTNQLIRELTQIGDLDAASKIKNLVEEYAIRGRGSNFLGTAIKGERILFLFDVSQKSCNTLQAKGYPYTKVGMEVQRFLKGLPITASFGMAKFHLFNLVPFRNSILPNSPMNQEAAVLWIASNLMKSNYDLKKSNIREARGNGNSRESSNSDRSLMGALQYAAQVKPDVIIILTAGVYRFGWVGVKEQLNAIRSEDGSEPQINFIFFSQEDKEIKEIKELTKSTKTKINIVVKE